MISLDIVPPTHLNTIYSSICFFVFPGKFQYPLEDLSGGTESPEMAEVRSLAFLSNDPTRFFKYAERADIEIMGFLMWLGVVSSLSFRWRTLRLPLRLILTSAFLHLESVSLSLRLDPILLSFRLGLILFFRSGPIALSLYLGRSLYPSPEPIIVSEKVE